MLTVALSGTSPASTMSVLTTPRTKTCRSLRLALTMRPIDKSFAPNAHYRPSLMENSETPMVNGGDFIPPLSLCVDAGFNRVSVGIPKSKPSRSIIKINELTYKNGYDFDGELSPFLDIVER